MPSNNLMEIGSRTAKNGFKNEDFVRDEFNNWQNSSLGQSWLREMKYDLEQIEYVRAEKVSGSFKADVQVSIMVIIKLKHLTDIQNLQIKLISNQKSSYNQIDKRWVSHYGKLWCMPSSTERLLKLYTGETLPYRKNTRDVRRMFADEFTPSEQSDLMRYIEDNKILIISDILKGRGEFHAEWMLVILKTESILDWRLKPINVVMNYFGSGPVYITKNGIERS